MALMKGRMDGIYLENKFLEELHVLALESGGICEHVSMPLFVLKKTEDRKKETEVGSAVPISICLWDKSKEFLSGLWE